MHRRRTSLAHDGGQLTVLALGDSALHPATLPEIGYLGPVFARAGASTKRAAGSSRSLFLPRNTHGCGVLCYRVPGCRSTVEVQINVETGAGLRVAARK